MAMSMSWTGTAGRSNCSRCGAARDNRRPGSARESRFPDRAKRASGIRRSRWPGGGRRGPNQTSNSVPSVSNDRTSIAGRPRSCRRKTGIVTVVPCCRKKPDSVASSQSVKSRSPTWSPSAPRDQPGAGPVLQDALVVPPVRLDEDRFPAEPLEIKRIAEVAPPPGAHLHDHAFGRQFNVFRQPAVFAILREKRSHCSILTRGRERVKR